MGFNVSTMYSNVYGTYKCGVDVKAVIKWEIVIRFMG
jgi:hypothetical protein